MKIVAEVGSNWKTLDDCLFSVREAKRRGADAVKFQLFTHKELYGVDGKMSHELNPDWLKLLKKEAETVRIEFMCTAFSPDGYELVNNYVSSHKIASAELSDPTILQKVNTFKKPVILSTAGSDLNEIDKALLLLDRCQVTVLFCVADYPAKVIDFRNLMKFRSHFKLRCELGYSDHSIDVLNIPMLARLHGARVLEKHVNFTMHTDTPDAGHSINGPELELMVYGLKNKVTLEHTDLHCNESMRKLWKRRLITLPNGTTGYYRTKS